MQQFEADYKALVKDILANGEHREGRNGFTLSKFGLTLDVRLIGSKLFPIIQGRKMYYKGVFGELAAMLRKPTKLEDFERWGCNYWKLWAKEDGSIAVDYGNAWHADGQIERLKDSLVNNPNDRRMLISGWRPSKLDELDLPCCHLLYQFYVHENGELDMLWYQRSADMMIGLPSDIIFAAAWLIMIANEFEYTPGSIKMVLGDCHIYSEHIPAAHKYVRSTTVFESYPMYELMAKPGKDFCEFEPSDLVISQFDAGPSLTLELKQ